MKQFCKLAGVFLIAGLLSACTGRSIDSNGPIALPHRAAILVIPFSNYSDTPEAGERVATMIAGMLRTKGADVYVYPQQKSCNPLETCKKILSQQKILRYAIAHNYEFIVKGEVNEWRYKVGLDGEPSVGVDITLQDVLSQEIIWTSVGSRTGHSWSGLSDTGQNLFQTMLQNIIIKR